MLTHFLMAHMTRYLVTSLRNTPIINFLQLIYTFLGQSFFGLVLIVWASLVSRYCSCSINCYTFTEFWQHCMLIFKMSFKIRLLMEFSVTERTLESGLFSTLIYHMPTHVSSMFVDFPAVVARKTTCRFRVNMLEKPVSLSQK